MRKKDSDESISQEEWNKAVLFLLNTLPLRFFRDIWKIMNKQGEKWMINYHHGLGTRIRNILRKADFNWGNIALDDYWHKLLQDAVELAKDDIQYYEKHPEEAEENWTKAYVFEPEPPSYPIKYLAQLLIQEGFHLDVFNHLKDMDIIIELHPIEGDYDIILSFLDEDGTMVDNILDIICAIKGIIQVSCMGPGPIVIFRKYNEKLKKWETQTTRF